MYSWALPPLARRPVTEASFQPNLRRPDLEPRCPLPPTNHYGLQILCRTCQVSSLIMFYFIQRLFHAGEVSGEWMCISRLAGKRVDVQVVGVMSLRERISPSMAALEGKNGWLLLTREVSLSDKKIMVYGAGKNGLKHAVDRTCIKPRRTGEMGGPLTKIQARVVILGDDVKGDSFYKGQYAETRPSLAHAYGDEVVGVKLDPSWVGAASAGPLFFHISRLSYAANLRTQLPDAVFDATNFG